MNTLLCLRLVNAMRLLELQARTANDCSIALHNLAAASDACSDAARLEQTILDAMFTPGSGTRYWRLS